MLRASRRASSQLAKRATAWRGGLRRRVLGDHFGESSDRMPGKWGELRDLALNRKRLDPNDPFHKFLLFHFRFRAWVAIGMTIGAMFTWPEHSLLARTIIAYWNKDKDKGKEEQPPMAEVGAEPPTSSGARSP